MNSSSFFHNLFGVFIEKKKKIVKRDVPKDVDLDENMEHLDH